MFYHTMTYDAALKFKGFGIHVFPWDFRRAHREFGKDAQKTDLKH